MPMTSLAKNLEASQLPAWISSKEQNELFKASGNVKIVDFTTVDQFNELNDFMKWWRMQLGITVVANHLEPQMNILHIKENYNDLSIEDLRLAVKYSFTGVLDVDFIAYNSFSPLYISKILNSYKEFRNDQLNAIARAKMKHDELANVVTKAKLTPIESRKALLYYYYQSIQTSDEYVIDHKGIGFDVFSRSGRSIDLSLYELKAIEMVEAANLKAKNLFEKAIESDSATIEKYQKWLCLKDYFKVGTVAEFIESLTDDQIMG